MRPYAAAAAAVVIALLFASPPPRAREALRKWSTFDSCAALMRFALPAASSFLFRFRFVALAAASGE